MGSVKSSSFSLVIYFLFYGIILSIRQAQQKLKQLIADTQNSACLQLELAAVIDAGKIFAKIVVCTGRR